MAGFLVPPHDVSELEIASLVLECGRAAAADEAPALMNKTAHFGGYLRIHPPPAPAPGGFGVTVADNDIHIVGNTGFLNFGEAEELDFDRQAGQAFQQVGPGDKDDVGALDKELLRGAEAVDPGFIAAPGI